MVPVINKDKLVEYLGQKNVQLNLVHVRLTNLYTQEGTVQRAGCLFTYER